VAFGRAELLDKMVDPVCRMGFVSVSGTKKQKFKPLGKKKKFLLEPTSKNGENVRGMELNASGKTSEAENYP